MNALRTLAASLLLAGLLAMDFLIPLIVSGFEPGDLREWTGCP